MKRAITFLTAAVLFCFAALSLAPATFAKEDYTYLYYENNFDDSASLSDFTAVRGSYEIRDGALYYAGADEEESPGVFSWLLYTADDFKLADYQLEVDVCDIQTACGIIFRADPSKMSGDTNYSFCGYSAFVNNDGRGFSLGRTSADCKNWAGNLQVALGVTEPGDSLHLIVRAEGKKLTVDAFNINTSELIFSYTAENGDWEYGTFGLRVRHENPALGRSNAGHVYFDNLRVIALGDTAAALLLRDGVDISTTAATAVTTALPPAETTEAPAETTAAPVIVTTEAPAETTAAPEETTAPFTADTNTIIIPLALALASAALMIMIIRKSPRKFPRR